MSIEKIGKNYYLRMRLLGKQIFMKTMALSKTEAKQVEMAVLTAIRSSDYRSLDLKAREFCVRMFQKQAWSLPEDLYPHDPLKGELNLWDAVDSFLNYPEIKASPSRWRHEISLFHIVEHFGKDGKMKSFWVPDIKRYQLERLKQGAKPGTINREISTLSRLFGVMIEYKLIEANPCRLVKRLSEKSGERQVYVSLFDVQRIVQKMPEWCGPIVLTAYYTGMRQGEILSLSRKQVDIGKRIITLGPEETKEGKWKKVPIHLDLIPVLENVSRVIALGTDTLFLVQGRAPHPHSIKNAWRRSVDKLGFHSMPRFHDLRHTWKTNARRSGMDSEIRERILGHRTKGLSVTERYGVVSDQELIKAVDLLTFDHGETEIHVATG